MTMATPRQLPILPIELMETYSEERIPLYHPVRGTTCIKQLNRLAIMLKQEAMLLQKIRYKQKNQHKSAAWWRHVSGSQRVTLRLLEQLDDSFIPNLPTAEDKQPVLTGIGLFRLTESSLRTLLLLDKTLSFHTKSAAAVQQLLRAALFMPLAMTLKALIARLHSIWVCVKDEAQVFLSLLRSSPKKKSQLSLDLEAYMIHLPQDLRSYWTALSPKASKIAKSKSVTASATTSTLPSRTQSPMTGRPLPEDGKSSLPHLPQAQHTSDVIMEPTRVPETMKSEIPITPVLDPEVTANATKKMKKRKKVVAKDDIDAIFAGL